jgi:soluble P-type ATPase
MFKLTQIILFLSLLNISLLTYAVPEISKPRLIQLEYDLSRNGKLFAKVKESFTQNGKTYNIKSVTKGIGVYALMGDRVSTSTGTVSKAGLKPNRFELRQGNKAKKTLIADFNWTKSVLTMQVKGETKTEKLELGTQDLASYVYQFMYNAPTKSDVKVTLTTGKKLNQYQYKVLARGEKLDAASKTFKTLHISNEAGAGDEKKQFWLAEEQFYLPVRYQLEEDGEMFEQTLTKIHVE